VSFIGTGGEDWVELDMDLFDRSRLSQLRSLLVDRGDEVKESIGADFELEAVDDGIVFVVIDGRRRYRAEVSRDDRLIFTGILDPEGPL